MKIALYIEDGLEQLVLTPESEHERAMVKLLTDGSRTVETRRGSFYECRGGYIRQGVNDDSAIMVLRRPLTENQEGKK